MTPLFLVRHGQSEWNAMGKIQGQAESPLTVLGRRQAALIGTNLSEVLRGMRLNVFAAVDRLVNALDREHATVVSLQYRKVNRTDFHHSCEWPVSGPVFAVANGTAVSVFELAKAHGLSV